jgi:hypothetical protein
MRHELWQVLIYEIAFTSWFLYVLFSALLFTVKIKMRWKCPCHSGCVALSLSSCIGGQGQRDLKAYPTGVCIHSLTMLHVIAQT